MGKRNKFIYLTGVSDNNITEVPIPIQVKPRVIKMFEIGKDGEMVKYYADGLRKGWIYVRESVSEIRLKLKEVRKTK